MAIVCRPHKIPEIEIIFSIIHKFINLLLSNFSNSVIYNSDEVHTMQLNKRIVCTDLMIQTAVNSFTYAIVLKNDLQDSEKLIVTKINIESCTVLCFSIMFLHIWFNKSVYKELNYNSNQSKEH